MEQDIGRACDKSRNLEPLSFSLGCLEGCENMALSPDSTSVQSPLVTNSLNRRKTKSLTNRDSVRNSWNISDKDEGNQEEFWASIREPYDYIMGTHLMPDSEISFKLDEICFDSPNTEMSWDVAEVSPAYVWSLSEFFDRYNELYEWLIQFQLKMYSHSNPPDRNTRSTLHEELQNHSYRRTLFLTQGEIVALRNSSSQEEIHWRVNYLKNKWDQLLATITPVKGRATDELDMELDLVHEEELLKSWLSSMEKEIQPITCRLPRGCSLYALQERYKDNQILLKDIEAHGPILKSVIRQYEKSASNVASTQSHPSASNFKPSVTSTESFASNLNSSLVFQPTNYQGRKSSSSAVPRKAKSLEKRWHQIYLRSLEWHYYLEGVVADFKEQNSSCFTDSEDEPLTKCRRLSTSSVNSIASQSPRKVRVRTWSDYEVHFSEAGSYIEDDYVQVSDLKSVQRKTKLKRKKRRMLSLSSSVKGVSANNSSANEMEFDQLKESFLDNHSGDENGTSSKNSPKRSTTDLLKVDNSSPNRGVFECKHVDTDSDNNNNGKDVSEVTKKENEPMRHRLKVSSFVRRKMDFMDDDEIDQEALQQIIDSAVLDPDWLNASITTDSEEGAEPEQTFDLQSSAQVHSNTNSRRKGSLPTSTKKSLDKDSIHKLINRAERLVSRDPLTDPAKVSPRSLLKPLTLQQPSGDTKQRRVKQWLKSQTEEEAAELCTAFDSSLQDSCDASGELTTDNSDDGAISGSDTENDISSATQKRSSGDGLFSSENTPTVEGLPPLELDKTSLSPIKSGLLKVRRSWSGGEDFQALVSSPYATKTSATGFGFSGISSTESTMNGAHPSSDETPKRNSFSNSDNADTCRMPSSVDSHSIPSQSPTVSSSTLLNQTPSTGQGSLSPSKISTTSIRKRRTRLRRKSSQLMCRRSDSGSDEKLASKSKGEKCFSYSPYQLSKISLSDAECSFPTCVPSSNQKGSLVSSRSPGNLPDSAVMNGGSHLPSATPPTPRRLNMVSPLSSSQSTNGSPMLTPRGLKATHQEDFSSLSEQAWDPYQDLNYMSEPYSEDIDRDGARKLMDFGDDYRKYIDSDASSFRGIVLRRRRKKSPTHRPKILAGEESDSDLDDLYRVVEESFAQLAATQPVLEKFSYQVTIGLDLTQLLSIAKTNLKCLRDVLRNLEFCVSLDSRFKETDIKSLLEKWENVASKAEECERHSAQLCQLQRQVKNLRLSMETVLIQCATYAHPQALDDASQIDSQVEEVAALLEQTNTLRSDLSNLSMLVHRFASEVGSAFDPLKDDVTELFRLWDEMHNRVNAELTRLRNAHVTWQLWKEQKLELANALKQDSDTLEVIHAAIDNGKLTDTVTASVHDVAKLLNERRKAPMCTKSRNQLLGSDKLTSSNELSKTTREDRFSDSGTSGYESCSSDDLSERERRLAYLRRLARELESTFVPGSKAWKEITSTLTDAEKELNNLQDHCRSLIVRTAETLDPSSTSIRFSSNSPKRRTWSRDSKGVRSPRLERRSNNVKASSSREWLWRVVRAALPFQAALLLLLCVGCLLEPSCCESANTFGFLRPQLRAVPGSTPI